MIETSRQEVTLTAEQESAVDRAVAFIDRGLAGEFRIGGFAGTGKTTLTKQIIARVDGRSPGVMALSGKAVSVLRSKGLDQAETIHSSIYKFDADAKRFDLRVLVGFDYFVVDEASMVSEQLYRDMQSFGMPMLFIGDHGQLEPVGSDVNLMAEDRLDAKLTEIHRQAAGNPIIEFSTAVRTGARFRYGTKGTVRIVPQCHFDWGQLLWPDQILCGTHRTRHGVNARVREQLGRGKDRLVAGEKLICLKNSREFGLFNGMGLTVGAIRDETKLHYNVDLETDDGEQRSNVPVLKSQLGRNRDGDQWRSDGDVLADYGYCITVHKAQGSEWDKVLVIEDSAAWDMRRWRYTAVTRAAAALIYCF